MFAFFGSHGSDHCSGEVCMLIVPIELCWLGDEFIKLIVECGRCGLKSETRRTDGCKTFVVFCLHLYFLVSCACPAVGKQISA